MKLYLLRHADAERQKEGMDDSDRALTEKGIKQIKDLINNIKSKEIIFDYIFTSPYKRAFQTAEIIANDLSLEERLIESPPLACGARTKEIRQIINAHQKSKEILCVGHEPDLGIIAGELLGIGGARPFSKAELVEIEL